MLSTPEWLTLVVSLGGSLAIVAVHAGALRARVGALTDTVRELRDATNRSNEDQGRRLGELEGWRKAVEAVDRERQRSKTNARGVGGGPSEGEP